MVDRKKGTLITPQPPDWRLDWDALRDEFQFVRDMQGCPQDPVYHAEGDVEIHTRMVCESLIENQRWRGLATAEREIVFAASLLHDVAKPATTRKENGRITSRGIQNVARLWRESYFGGWARRFGLVSRRQTWFVTIKSLFS